MRPHRWLIVLLTVLPVDAEAQLAFTCDYSVTPLVDFGTTGLPTPQIDVAPVAITVTCTSLLNLLNGLRVCLSMPVGSGGNTIADRRMVQGAYGVGYQLYRDAGRTQTWGTFGDAVPLTFTFALLNIPVTQNVVAYARVASGQSGMAVGTYESVLVPVARRASYSILGSPPACAGVVTDEEALSSLTTRVAIEPDCTVSAAPLDFGTVTDLGGHSATTNLAVTCTLNGAYSVALDGGTVSGDITARRLRLGAAPGSTIDYQLYRDAGHAQIWGNTPATLLLGTGTGSAQSIPIYGFVPAQGAKPVGRYEDTITVTVTF